MNNGQKTDQPSNVQEKFAEDLRSAAEATGTLIEQGAEEMARASEQFKEVVGAATELAQTAMHVVGEQVEAGVKATDRAVRANPYQAVGIALAAGFLVGWLIKRK